jgi:hypothetical protein
VQGQTEQWVEDVEALLDVLLPHKGFFSQCKL